MKNRLKKGAKKGNYVVIARNGEPVFVRKADRDLRIEGPDSVAVTEKAESKLTKKEKAKIRK